MCDSLNAIHPSQLKKIKTIHLNVCPLYLKSIHLLLYKRRREGEERQRDGWMGGREVRKDRGRSGGSGVVGFVDGGINGGGEGG